MSYSFFSFFFEFVLHICFFVFPFKHFLHNYRFFPCQSYILPSIALNKILLFSINGLTLKIPSISKSNWLSIDFYKLLNAFLISYPAAALTCFKHYKLKLLQIMNGVVSLFNFRAFTIATGLQQAQVCCA